MIVNDIVRVTKEKIHLVVLVVTLLNFTPTLPHPPWSLIHR